MKPFPTFEADVVRHEAYGGCITFVMRPMTFGAGSLVYRLREAFQQIDPGADRNSAHGRATLLAQTVDIHIDEEAARTHAGFAALARFWEWRKSVTDAELIDAAADVWNWFQNVAPFELLYGDWDKAVEKTFMSSFSAPRELRPDPTEKDKEDPNS